MFSTLFLKLRNNDHFLNSKFEGLVCSLLMLDHTQRKADIILWPAFWLVTSWTNPSKPWNSSAFCTRPWWNLLFKPEPYSLPRTYWFPDETWNLGETNRLFHNIFLNHKFFTGTLSETLKNQYLSEVTDENLGWVDLSCQSTSTKRLI